MEIWLWILVAAPFVAGAGLFAWELSILGKGPKPTETQAPTPEEHGLGVAVRRRAATRADEERAIADHEYAWEER